MALQKQPVSINFIRGIDTKTDPYQINMSQFALLHNTVFTATGRLTKRNGYSNLTSLPNKSQTNLMTLNDNLVATGTNLYAYSADSNQWLNKGVVQPVQLETQPLVRVSTSQSGSDTAVTSNGLTVCAYMDSGNSYYQISDSNTGQQLLNRVQLESTATNPRTFLLGRYFVITYIATVSSTPTLRYVAIPIMNITSATAATTISSDVASLSAGYDGYVAVNNNLYLSWSNGSGGIDIVYMTTTLALSTITVIAGHPATLMSVTADYSFVYVSYWDSGSTNGQSISFNFSLAPVMTSTPIITGVTITELTSIVLPTGNLQVIYETYNVVTQLNSTQQDYVSTVVVTPATGTGIVTSPVVVLRAVGLASKPCAQYSYTLNSAPNTIVNSALLPTPGTYTLISYTIYVLTVYGASSTSVEPTYFLIDILGQIYMKLAYSNGGGYEQTQVLPSIVYNNGAYNVSYLYKDFLTSVNKTTGTNTPAAAIYSQTGINLASFTINDSQQYSSEIASALHLTGGQLWEYDAVKPVEHGFHIWPENESVTTSTTGGFITAQQYFYQFTYEWTDNVGNLHRSAPSIPITITTTGSTSSNTLYVPTLRETYKAQPNPTYGTATTAGPNPVRIVGYRWSTANQEYYQFTSVTSPTLNNPSVDYVTITDTLADSSIIGNALIYTTGGVIEDIGAPASIASCLFNNRLWLVDAEDRNLLWYSKQVIEAVPVEMSDLLTIYVAPTSGAQGSTGPITALNAMDDKLIIFKKDAIYYINGIGPDNTGSNSQYSDPVFITAAVGCSNPDSIALMPNGLMFQSDKGIWLLGRDLSTTYIGAAVEAYNDLTIVSAQNIPGQNQVRFVANGTSLMYDYFNQAWGTHSNTAAISATLYQSQQTYLNSYGQVLQETPGMYLDGSEPVLMSMTTAWINVAGLQGYERFYFGYLLGTYFSPFTLDVQIAYDYNPSATQNIKIIPDNYAPPYGGNANWGSGGSWGAGTNSAGGDSATANVFEARFFPAMQKCESFQITINEVYDSTIGAPAGEGLTLSGLNLIVGTKRGYRTQRASRSFGSN
jgi:hypothetical protein